jgi:hypothetical protein
MCRALQIWAARQRVPRVYSQRLGHGWRGSTTRWRVTIAALVAVLIASGASVVVTPQRASANPSPLPLPWPEGQTWYVCQGYNGLISHQGKPQLDLSIDPRAAGPSGCTPSTKNSSYDKPVLAPGSGRVKRINGFRGPDFVCLTFDAGGSMAIGHLSNRAADGPIEAGKTLGTVEAAGYNNGNYAHIHVQFHSGSGCGKSPLVPFDDAHQARFQCAPNLPFDLNSRKTNQYSGLALTRCATTSPGPPPLPGGSSSLDLVFAIDSTGSMGPYINAV